MNTRPMTLAIVAAILLTRGTQDGVYDHENMIEEAADLLRAAEDADRNDPTAPRALALAHELVTCHEQLAQLRGNLAAATLRWAQLVYDRNAGAGPREQAFSFVMAEVNNFRHACGLPMLSEGDFNSPVRGV